MVFEWGVGGQNLIMSTVLFNKTIKNVFFVHEKENNRTNPDLYNQVEKSQEQ